jgi:hypothetical protein
LEFWNSKLENVARDRLSFKECLQGDQIWRIFAKLVTDLGQFFEKFRISQKFWVTFFHDEGALNWAKNSLG